MDEPFTREYQGTWSGHFSDFKIKSAVFISPKSWDITVEGTFMSDPSLAYLKHPEYTAHLTGILKTPNDNLRREVLADWLDEHGENERAEFIRVQCELSHFGEDDLKEQKPHWIPRCEPGYRRWERAQALRRRERELWGTPGFADKFSSLTTCVLPDHKKTQFRLWTEYGPLLTVRRGFVAEVRCRLADWCGGGDGSCDGRDGMQCNGGRTVRGFGRYGNPIHGGKCGVCSGTGRISGIGPRLVREHPVEKVVLTDKSPSHGENDNAPGWHRQNRTHDDDDIPEWLWPHLLEAGGHIQRESTWIWYSTSVAAITALSAALITWAKRQNMTQAERFRLDHWGY